MYVSSVSERAHNKISGDKVLGKMLLNSSLLSRLVEKVVSSVRPDHDSSLHLSRGVDDGPCNDGAAPDSTVLSQPFLGNSKSSKESKALRELTVGYCEILLCLGSATTIQSCITSAGAYVAPGIFSECALGKRTISGSLSRCRLAGREDILVYNHGRFWDVTKDC